MFFVAYSSLAVYVFQDYVKWQFLGPDSSLDLTPARKYKNTKDIQSQKHII